MLIPLRSKHIEGASPILPLAGCWAVTPVQAACCLHLSLAARGDGPLQYNTIAYYIENSIMTPNQVTNGFLIAPSESVNRLCNVPYKYIYAIDGLFFHAKHQIYLSNINLILKQYNIQTRSPPHVLCRGQQQHVSTTGLKGRECWWSCFQYMKSVFASTFCIW